MTGHFGAQVPKPLLSAQPNVEVRYNGGNFGYACPSVEMLRRSKRFVKIWNDQDPQQRKM